MKMSYGEALKYFKNLKQMDKVIPLFRNKPLIEALLAWKSVTIKYKQSGLEYECCDDNSLWEQLWENVEFDGEKWASVAGIKPQQANDFHSRLKGYHLIYPDGSVDSLAIQYINSIIIKELDLHETKTANKSEPKSEKKTT